MEDLHLATAMCIGLRRSSSPHKPSVGTSMFSSRSVVSVSAEDFAIRRKPSGPGQALPGRQEGRLRRVGRLSRWERRKEGRRVGLLHTQVMIGGSGIDSPLRRTEDTGLRIGLQVPRFTWPDAPDSIGPKLAQIGEAAEEAGFASIWVMDHFFQIGGVGEAEEPMLEGYSALNYLTGITQQVKLDTLVTGVHYRHPGILLKTATTLDVLSGGRAYLGIGAGWYERESSHRRANAKRKRR
jgi:hypothetical protein